MLIPCVPIEDFITRAGFRRCKKPYSQMAYLCVARGKRILLVSREMFVVSEWRDDDPRIHKTPNCRYSDNRESFDIIYELIKSEMLRGENDEYNNRLLSLFVWFQNRRHQKIQARRLSDAENHEN